VVESGPVGCCSPRPRIKRAIRAAAHRLLDMIRARADAYHRCNCNCVDTRDLRLPRPSPRLTIGRGMGAKVINKSRVDASNDSGPNGSLEDGNGRGPLPPRPYLETPRLTALPLAQCTARLGTSIFNHRPNVPGAEAYQLHLLSLALSAIRYESDRGQPLFFAIICTCFLLRLIEWRVRSDRRLASPRLSDYGLPPPPPAPAPAPAPAPSSFVSSRASRTKSRLFLVHGRVPRPYLVSC
jgi:hypothetical protein